MARLCHAAVLTVLLASAGLAAECVFPDIRSVYYVDEPIELAFAGLEPEQRVAVSITPEEPGPLPLEFHITGDGSTLLTRLPPFALAPATYQIALDGTPSQSLTVARGIPASTMLVSQTARHTRLRQGGANFALTNAFSFGLIDGGRPATTDLRRLSIGQRARAELMSISMPELVYMYWIGYVTHKPWGAEKEWCSPDMTRNMRLFNFHVAQRLRRFERNIVSIGSIDEPGLPWGRTPEGHFASGFPGWNTQAWYEDRGWEFTRHPASRPDADWLRYMHIRCSMIGEQCRQAAEDIKAVMPAMRYASDMYAPQAIMDGADPWNQHANDIPTTHVFADWGYGKLGVTGALYLEKAHDPTARVAHAMNGQLFGNPVAQPQQRYAYHLMLNALLAGGIRSNWWLNYRGMSDEDLAAVNEPAHRIGPALLSMSPSEHDVAILWSFTELAMRCKAITAREATRETGEQLRMTIPGLPVNADAGDDGDDDARDGQIIVNAYSVGGNYKSEILTAWQAINRAGYPVHILHERLLSQGILDQYKVLVILGQTADLPAETQQALAQFTASGGRIITDKATTVNLPGAIVTDATFANQGYFWGAMFGRLGQEEPRPNIRDASYWQTNYYMDHFARVQIEAIKASLGQTEARPVIRTNSPWLGCERHVGGDGRVIMLLNGHENLPEIPENAPYPIWNYASYETAVQFPRLDDNDVVYVLEGLDWRTSRKLEDPQAEQAVTFEPGEMKLYFVAPREPEGLALTVTADSGGLHVQVQLEELAMPWPLTVALAGPDGRPIETLYRATDARGHYRETIPLGAGAAPGRYAVAISSPLVGLHAETQVDVRSAAVLPEIVDAAARVFDQAAIAQRLASREPLVIVLGADAHRATADHLAAALSGAGIPTTVASEGDVWRKAMYPRVWNPYIRVHMPVDEDKPLGTTEIPATDDRPATTVHEKVLRTLNIESNSYDTPTVTVAGDDEAAGSAYTGEWRSTPGTLLIVGDKGFIDLAGREQFYAAGCKLYVNARERLVVINGEPELTATTPEVRKQWSRPWKNLTPYAGGLNLVPQLPEAYSVSSHLILLGDSTSSELVAALQASELLPQVVDEAYPGPGKALVQYAWSPFSLEKDVIFIGATDAEGLAAGADALVQLLALQAE